MPIKRAIKSTVIITTQVAPETSFLFGQVTFIIPGLPGFYLMLVVFPLGAGVLLSIASPLLRRMMAGRA